MIQKVKNRRDCKTFETNYLKNKSACSDMLELTLECILYKILKNAALYHLESSRLESRNDQYIRHISD